MSDVWQRQDKWKAGYVTKFCPRVYKMTEKEKAIKEEGQIRQKLNEEIREMLKQGKAINEIIETLNQNEQYQKYSQYFSVWINNQEKNLKKTENKEEMER